MALDLSKPVLNLSVAVEASWGDGSGTGRYVRGMNDLTLAGSPFSAVPEIEIEQDKLRGGVRPSNLTLRIKRGLEPFETMRTEQHAPVEVSVYEFDRTDLNTLDLIFQGDVGEVTSHRNGEADILSVKCLGPKYRLRDVPMGLIAIDSCDWSFGDPSTCGFNVASVTDSAVVTAISGDRVTMSGLANSAVNDYYGNGFLRYQGLSLRIRRHSGSTGFLYLQRPAPQSWIGQTVAAVPGCRKSLTACRDKWSNEERFMGIGRRMPEYEPRFEDGS